MSKRSAVALAIAVGSSLLGCSDEKASPSAGPDVSWQVLCADSLLGVPDPTDSCSIAEDPHGPLDGRSVEDKTDDYTLEVSCTRLGSGLALEIEDPGRPRSVEKQQPARARSILSVTRADPTKNECIVAVTEYPLDNEPAELLVKDSCAGNGSAPGTCRLTGQFDSNGYAFEGTIECDGLRYRGQGTAGWALRAAAPNNGAPVKLQVSHCD
jgi:hypothetical protein